MLRALRFILFFYFFSVLSLEHSYPPPAVYDPTADERFYFSENAVEYQNFIQARNLFFEGKFKKSLQNLYDLHIKNIAPARDFLAEILFSAHEYTLGDHFLFLALNQRYRPSQRLYAQRIIQQTTVLPTPDAVYINPESMKIQAAIEKSMPSHIYFKNNPDQKNRFLIALQFFHNAISNSGNNGTVSIPGYLPAQKIISDGLLSNLQTVKDEERMDRSETKQLPSGPHNEKKIDQIIKKNSGSLQTSKRKKKAAHQALHAQPNPIKAESKKNSKQTQKSKSTVASDSKTTSRSETEMQDSGSASANESPTLIPIAQRDILSYKDAIESFENYEHPITLFEFVEKHAPAVQFDSFETIVQKKRVNQHDANILAYLIGKRDHKGHVSKPCIELLWKHRNALEPTRSLRKTILALHLQKNIFTDLYAESMFNFLVDFWNIGEQASGNNKSLNDLMRRKKKQHQEFSLLKRLRACYKKETTTQDDIPLLFASIEDQREEPLIKSMRIDAETRVNNLTEKMINNFDQETVWQIYHHFNMKKNPKKTNVFLKASAQKGQREAIRIYAQTFTPCHGNLPKEKVKFIEKFFTEQSEEATSWFIEHLSMDVPHRQLIEIILKQAADRLHITVVLRCLEIAMKLDYGITFLSKDLLPALENCWVESPVTEHDLILPTYLAKGPYQSNAFASLSEQQKKACELLEKKGTSYGNLYKETQKEIILYHFFCIFINSLMAEKKFEEAWLSCTQALKRWPEDPDLELIAITLVIKQKMGQANPQIYRLVEKLKGILAYAEIVEKIALSPLTADCKDDPQLILEAAIALLPYHEQVIIERHRDHDQTIELSSLLKGLRSSEEDQFERKTNHEIADNICAAVALRLQEVNEMENSLAAHEKIENSYKKELLKLCIHSLEELQPIEQNQFINHLKTCTDSFTEFDEQLFERALNKINGHKRSNSYFTTGIADMAFNLWLKNKNKDADRWLSKSLNLMAQSFLRLSIEKQQRINEIAHNHEALEKFFNLFSESLDVPTTIIVNSLDLLMSIAEQNLYLDKDNFNRNVIKLFSSLISRNEPHLQTQPLYEKMCCIIAHLCRHINCQETEIVQYSQIIKTIYNRYPRMASALYLMGRIELVGDTEKKINKKAHYGAVQKLTSAFNAGELQAGIFLLKHERDEQSKTKIAIKLIEKGSDEGFAYFVDDVLFGAGTLVKKYFHSYEDLLLEMRKKGSRLDNDGKRAMAHLICYIACKEKDSEKQRGLFHEALEIYQAFIERGLTDDVTKENFYRCCIMTHTAFDPLQLIELPTFFIDIGEIQYLSKEPIINYINNLLTILEETKDIQEKLFGQFLLSEATAVILRNFQEISQEKIELCVESILGMTCHESFYTMLKEITGPAYYMYEFCLAHSKFIATIKNVTKTNADECKIKALETLKRAEKINNETNDEHLKERHALLMQRYLKHGQGPIINVFSPKNSDKRQFKK